MEFVRNRQCSVRKIHEANRGLLSKYAGQQLPNVLLLLEVDFLQEERLSERVKGAIDERES
jgi:hypothetical protein